jgi:ClpA/ClpB-like protein
VVAATARGVLWPDTEHLLIALGEQELPARILAELGVSSAEALVDASYPVDRLPVDHALIEGRAAQIAAHGVEPPRPGPIKYQPDPEHDNAFTYVQPPYAPATGIFTPEARRIVAEDVLIIAERIGHPALTTGHVLLAILERYDYLTIDFINALPPIREITAAVTDALPGQEDT